MSTDSTLADLLERWEEAKEQGQSLTPEQLCADFPELLESLRQQIAALEEVDRKLKQQTDEPNEVGASNGDPAGELPDRTLTIACTFAEPALHAKGGLGAVYAFTDEHLHRRVALKFIHRRLVDDQESRDRFLTEAEVTARLEHPGIVPVHGVGETENGRLFYAMRFIQGNTLDSAIDKFHRSEDLPGRGDPRIMEFRRLLDRFVAVCQTIAFAHNRGIVHLDVKPENIMLGRYGETIVVDWGLAIPVDREGQFKQADEKTLALRSRSQSKTESSENNDQTVGTPAYMSPERHAGSSNPGPASDIYSLGVTLYKVLSGQTPFQGNSLGQIKRQVLGGEICPPSQVKRNVPPALESVCLKAMAEKPAERYLTALELAEDVENYLADEPVTVYQEPLFGKLTRWSRRHRTLAQAALLGLVGLVIIAAVSTVLLARSADRERTARESADRAREQGLRVSAKFAARTVASEIDLRWRILETEANDSQLRTFLAEINASPDVVSLRVPLIAWIHARFAAYNKTTKADSWFITDRTGTQVARSPEASSIGKNYAHRSYFHGKPHDLTREEGVKAGPIQRVNMSGVYRSSTSKKLKVAFSLPIWSGRTPPDRHVLGVLGMSVELGEFVTLQTDLVEDQQAVLVDLREDRLETRQPRRGLILHHRGLKPLGPVQRLHLSVVKRMASAVEPDPHQLRDNLLLDYQDPLDATGGHWIAAFEPVYVEGRPEESHHTGWWVIVQQRKVSSE